MILKESGRKKGKNLNKTLMKEIEKPSIDIEELKLITFKNIIVQDTPVIEISNDTFIQVGENLERLEIYNSR